jgi:hypothetical protein
MSQTLKRPMFRKGGPVMEGIMDGIVDRQQMNTGGFLSPFGSVNPVTSVGQRPGGFLFQDFVREAGRLKPNVIDPRGIFSTTSTTTTAPAQKLGFKEGSKQFLQRGRGLGRTAVRLAGQGIRSIPGAIATPVGMSIAVPGAVLGTVVAADQAAEAARRRGDFIIEGEKFDPETGKVIDEGTIGDLTFLEQELAGSEGLPTDRPVSRRDVDRVRKEKLEELRKEQIAARLKRPGGLDNVSLSPVELSRLGIDPKTLKTKKERAPGLGEMGEKTDDPEKTLMDAYKENLGVIEQVLNTSDEDTKAQLYLQLAKFGAGLASQPGGSLTAAIGRAAEKPLEGVSKVISDRAKEKREIKTLALSKAFEDVKPTELEKQVEAVQKILGGTKEGALKFIKGDTRNPALIAAQDKSVRETGKELGLNPDVFLNTFKKLIQAHPTVGYNIYAKATKPENIETDLKDMVEGEYYTFNSQIVRYMPLKEKPLQEPGDPGFTEKVSSTTS